MRTTPRPKLLRFLTFNLWGENGPWQSRLALAAERLGKILPDVVGLQEVRDVAGRVGNQAAALAQAHGWNYVFAPSTAWGGGHEGLAIVSRFPIGAHESRSLPHSTETEGRIVLSARVDSDYGPIWVHTAHLSFREHEGAKREQQVQVIDEVVAAHANDHPQIILGDFNAVPEADEIRWLKGLTTVGGRRVFYQDAWSVARPEDPGYTWTRANTYTSRLFWLQRDRRLDYIFVTPVRRDGRGTVYSARLTFDEPEVQPSGERLFASDHLGVVAEVQMASDSRQTAELRVVGL